MGVGALVPVDRNDEGVVDVVLDATTNCAQSVSLERLLGWHAALFPTGCSRMSSIRTGYFRDDAEGPMQVVSGPVNRPRVHVEAPPAASLALEVDCFLDWLNGSEADSPLLKGDWRIGGS